MKNLTFFITITFWSWLAESQIAAAPMAVNTGAANSSNFQSVVFAGQAGRGQSGRVDFVVKNKCFGTNLRSVANPLSPLSTIILRVGIANDAGVITYYQLKYPASSVTASGSGQAMELDPSQVFNNKNIEGNLVGNILRFKTPLMTVTNVDAKGIMSYKRSGTIASLNFIQEFNSVTLTGQPSYPLYSGFSNRLCANCMTSAGSQIYLKKALPFKSTTESTNYFIKYPLSTNPVSDLMTYNAAYQKWYNWFLPALLTERAAASTGPYMGLPGPLSAHINIFNSKDGKTIEIAASFPGQEGYCGGYHSPLMVFFDGQRPKFTATVNFPINPSGKTMWPEANSSGAFIAYDRVEDGMITRADELFGNSEKNENGFEALRPFDSNKDNIVDNKDNLFHKLLLWHDLNGDGFSQPGELSALKNKIKSISLNYSNKEITSFGSRAEVREKSSFTYWNKGQEKKGDVLDIWFSPEK